MGCLVSGSSHLFSAPCPGRPTPLIFPSLHREKPPVQGEETLPTKIQSWISESSHPSLRQRFSAGGRGRGWVYTAQDGALFQVRCPLADPPRWFSPPSGAKVRRKEGRDACPDSSSVLINVQSLVKLSASPAAKWGL